jgi:hypothetical protein
MPCPIGRREAYVSVGRAFPSVERASTVRSPDRFVDSWLHVGHALGHVAQKRGKRCEDTPGDESSLCGDLLRHKVPSQQQRRFDSRGTTRDSCEMRPREGGLHRQATKQALRPLSTIEKAPGGPMPRTGRSLREAGAPEPALRPRLTPGHRCALGWQRHHRATTSMTPRGAPSHPIDRTPPSTPVTDADADAAIRQGRYQSAGTHARPQTPAGAWHTGAHTHRLKTCQICERVGSLITSWQEQGGARGDFIGTRVQARRQIWRGATTVVRFAHHRRQSARHRAGLCTPRPRHDAPRSTTAHTAAGCARARY